MKEAAMTVAVPIVIAFAIILSVMAFVANPLTLGDVKEIAVTDTIPLLPHTSVLPIVVLKTGELFGETIHRIHCGESISEMLGRFG